MDKATLLTKLEEGVDSLRDLLDEHDGSTIETIKTSAKKGFQSLKKAFMENEKAQKTITDLRAKFEDLEEAVIKGDKKLSAKLLKTVEKGIQSCKEGSAKAQTSKAQDTKAKAAKAKAAPAKKAAAKKAPAAKTATGKTTAAKSTAKKPTAKKPAASTKAAPKKKATK